MPLLDRTSRIAVPKAGVIAAAALLNLALPSAAHAQTVATVHAFCSEPNCADGATPYASPIQATDGNFYGTTYDGSVAGAGVVYRMTPSGTVTGLYSFCSVLNCADGAEPTAALLQARSGGFYGTTSLGGAYGRGTVFTLTLDGKLTTLHSFCAAAGCADGSEPVAPLIQGSDGDFYGSTYGGGTYGYGSVFKITPGGVLTTLYSFCAQANCADGEGPNSSLVEATDGNFYGATYYGGADGGGTVFKLTRGGSLTTFHDFCSEADCADGSNPLTLIQAANGKLYGTTQGGDSSGFGTVYELTLSGALTTLHSFCSQPGCADGSRPYAPLVQATDGNFYGTTIAGGANDAGTVFRIDAGGRLTNLYSFCSLLECADGGGPIAPLIQATAGVLYGTARVGGSSEGEGTIFRLSAGLGPFVALQTVFGKVGSRVSILGNKLTGASSVSFGGASATFTVNATGTAITATVPAGATTGTVQVVTPNGTLNSNVVFTVT
jgi:uncharacterized repeat protein (TIGR03803 family)